MQFDAVKDSGQRQEFVTGSRRDTRDGKGRYDLIPTKAMKRLAQHYENGAKKYGDRNWENGQPLSRYVDSMLRHAFCCSEGLKDEDHFAAVCWNALAFIETEDRINRGLLPKELDDMPKGDPPTLPTIEVGSSPFVNYPGTGSYTPPLVNYTLTSEKK